MWGFALLLVGDLLAGTGFGTCVCGNVCCVGLLAGVCLRVALVCIDCCVYCCLGWSVLFTCVCFGLVGLC